MSIIDKKYLQADEVIEYSEKQSPKGSLLFIVWFSLMIISSAIIFIGSYFGQNTYYTLGIIYILIALIPLSITLNNRKTVYAISNKRVIIQWGIFKTKISFITYVNAASVEILETFLGKYFGFSTVIIIIAGFAKANGLYWKYSESAARVKDMIENHILNAAKKA